MLISKSLDPFNARIWFVECYEGRFDTWKRQITALEGIKCAHQSNEIAYLASYLPESSINFNLYHLKPFLKMFMHWIFAENHVIFYIYFISSNTFSINTFQHNIGLDWPKHTENLSTWGVAHFYAEIVFLFRKYTLKIIKSIGVRNSIFHVGSIFLKFLPEKYRGLEETVLKTIRIKGSSLESQKLGFDKNSYSQYLWAWCHFNNEQWNISL